MAQVAIKKIRIYGTDIPPAYSLGSPSVSTNQNTINYCYPSKTEDVFSKAVDALSTTGDMNDGNQYKTANSSDFIWLNNEYYAVNNGLLTGINQSTTLQDFQIHNSYASGLATAVTKNGITISKTDYIGTGMTVQLLLNKAVFSEVQVLLYGDLDGNGCINMLDLIMLKNHLLQKGQLEGLKRTAADLTNDKAISVIDLLNLKSMIGFN